MNVALLPELLVEAPELTVAFLDGERGLLVVELVELNAEEHLAFVILLATHDVDLKRSFNFLRAGHPLLH